MADKAIANMTLDELDDYQAKMKADYQKAVHAVADKRKQTLDDERSAREKAAAAQAAASGGVTVTPDTAKIEKRS